VCRGCFSFVQGSVVPFLMDVRQCVKQTTRVSFQPLSEGPIEWNSVQRPPEVLAWDLLFFLTLRRTLREYISCDI
jgi:hypothetical protein